MTAIDVRFDVPGPSGRLPARGTLVWAPTLRRVADDGAIVLPAPFRVNLSVGSALVEVEPTGKDWAWRVEEVLSGAPQRVVYLAVPDSSAEVRYSDLVAVDPATLVPAAAPEAAWWAALDNAETTVADGAAAASASADEAGVYALDAGTSATSAGQAAAAALGHKNGAEGFKNDAAASAAAAAATAAGVANNSVRTVNYGTFKGEKAGPVPVLIRGTGPVFGTPAKFGAASLKASGYYQQVSNVVPDPGAVGITIEHWFNATAAPSTPAISLCWALSSNIWGGISANTGTYAVCWASTPQSRVTSTVSVTDGQWHHIAVQMSRSGGVTQYKGFWIDGVPVAGTPTNSALAWSALLNIFGFESTGFDYPAFGNAAMDELCVTSGLKYTQGQAFTPPASAVTVDANTLVLHRGESNATTVPKFGYPARPAGAAAVEFIGPEEPTAEWLENDRWYKV